MTACVTCFPLDLVRTRILTSGHTYGTNALGVLLRIAREEGVGALYVGCVPAVVGMAPAGAVFYGSYDLMKHQHLLTMRKVGARLCLCLTAPPSPCLGACLVQSKRRPS